MRKRLLVLFVAALLLAGCAAQDIPDATEEQIQYDWMAGECPLSIRRTGMVNAGMNFSDFEVTGDGTYFIYQHPYYSINRPFLSPVILYADHGSDTLIKLCGRADCTHSTEDCDAYIFKGAQIVCYDGYLYAIEGDSSGGMPSAKCKLLRMDADGTNRVEVLNLLQFAQRNGYTNVSNSTITNGVGIFGMTYYEPQPDGTSMQYVEHYYYKLDGSMEEPKPMGGEGYFLYSCGDVFLNYGEAQNGGEYGGYYDWDPETNTTTFLTDHPGTAGWYGKEEGYYFKNGALHRLTYATGETEILLDTGLEGNYDAIFFPDCIVVSSKDGESTPDNNLYIYNWAYELVDTVEIDYYPFGWDLDLELILAETSERFILANSPYGMPQYYINKSELGTGNVSIHEFKMPDLADELEYYEEEFADLEWFENG